jgi:hypothetical protein
VQAVRDVRVSAIAAHHAHALADTPVKVNRDPTRVPRAPDSGNSDGI